jgi:hypothetical protein
VGTPLRRLDALRWRYYGFKLQLLADVRTGLPLGWQVETARRNESLSVAPLLDAARARCATTEADLFVMNADGSGIARVTDSPENELSKSWSPSGDKVVADFSALTGAALHKGDIAIITVAGGATTNLTNTPDIQDEHSEWSSR